MSIMTWKCDLQEGNDPRIVLEYPSNDEMAMIIRVVEETLAPITREGYEIHCAGSCCKAPQGINWVISVEFESIGVADVLARALTQKFGPPEGLSKVDALNSPTPKRPRP